MRGRDQNWSFERLWQCVAAVLLLHWRPLWQVTCASERCEVVSLAKRDFLRLVEQSSAVRRSFEALRNARIEHNDAQAIDFKAKAKLSLRSVAGGVASVAPPGPQEAADV